jgi:hypothetical protein
MWGKKIFTLKKTDWLITSNKMNHIESKKKNNKHVAYLSPHSIHW